MISWKKTIGSVVFAVVFCGALGAVISGCGGKDWGIQNIPPKWDPIADEVVTEGSSLVFQVSAHDQDSDSIWLSVRDQPANSQFVDDGDGTGTFTFIPNFEQVGVFSPIFEAYDGISTASEPMTITVVDSIFFHHSGEVTVDTLWRAADNPHLVLGDIIVLNGAIITIEPGCEVFFEEGKQLLVGPAQGSGGLIAQGTAANSILFTSISDNPHPGIWDGITFGENCLTSSILEYCVVEYGGANAFGNVLVEDSEISINNCLLRQSSTNGVFFGGDGRAKSFNANQITENNSYPVVVSCNYLGRLSGSSLTGNIKDTLVVRGTIIDQSASWDTLGVPLRITSTFEIRDGAVLTIVPGNTVLLDRGVSIEVGITSEGTLIADGTTDTIYFTSAAKTPGSWEALSFGEFSGSGCLLASCVVEYGAENTKGNVYLEDGAVAINNTIIRHSAQYGIYLDGDGRFTSFEGNTLTENAEYPVRISARQVQGLTTTTSYTGNVTADIIEVAGATLEEDATWKDLGVDYWMMGTAKVENDATLTIAAGSKLLFANGMSITVGQGSTGTLIADGSGGTIVFSTLDPNRNWNGLYFMGHTTENTLLDNCQITYAGKSKTKGAVYADDCQLTIRNCEINNSAGNGVVFDGTAYAPIFAGNIITENGNFPVSINSDFAGLLSPDNQVTGNVEDSFELTGTAITTDAAWADPGIPYTINSSIAIDSGVTLTFNPGVNLRFGSDPSKAARSGFRVAAGATLIADGTSDQISMTAAGPSNWQGLIFEPGASPASILKNCLIDKGGATSLYNPNSGGLPGCVHVDGCVITITDCTITGSKRNGVFFKDSAYAVEFHGNEITGHAGYPVRIDCDRAHYLTVDNTYGVEGDLKRGVEIGGEIYNSTLGLGFVRQNATWLNLGDGNRYFVFDSIQVVGLAQLTIEAGTELMIRTRAVIQIGDQSQNASIIADGTVAEPILFTMDPGTVFNQWGSLTLNGRGNDVSVIDNCILEFGGNAREGTIELMGCSPSITNCTIRDGLACGIARDAASSPTLSDNIFLDNDGVDVCEVVF